MTFSVKANPGNLARQMMCIQNYHPTRLISQAAGMPAAPDKNYCLSIYVLLPKFSAYISINLLTFLFPLDPKLPVKNSKAKGLLTFLTDEGKPGSYT